MYQRIIRKYLPGLIILGMAMLLGILNVGTYGMAWDEPAQHLIGTMNYNYAFHGDQSLLTFYDKEYGAAFELPLLMVERSLHLSDTRGVYVVRHIISHLFFLLSVFTVYWMLLRAYSSQWLSVIGMLMLLCAPRIYAHSFFNTKDIPFLCAIIFSLAAAQRAFSDPKPQNYLLLGATMGFTAGIRIMAVVPLCILLFFMVADALISLRRSRKLSAPLMPLSLFALGLSAVLYGSCPYFWTDPLHRVAGCFTKMAQKGFCGYDLLNGQRLNSLQLPWYYLPEWIGITTPPLWLGLSIAGMVTLMVQLLQQPAALLDQRQYRLPILAMLFFSAPVLAVVVLKSVVYDEWRHLYFVYPSLVILAVHGLHSLRNLWLRSIMNAGILLQAGVVLSFMIVVNPMQQIYFNALVPHQPEYLRKNFERDYWGCSIGPALKELVRTDPQPVLRVASLDFGPCLENNIEMLPPSLRRLFSLTDSAKAQYYVTTFRNHPNDFTELEPVIQLRAQNSTVICIYRRK